MKNCVCVPMLWSVCEHMYDLLLCGRVYVCFLVIRSVWYVIKMHKFVEARFSEPLHDLFCLYSCLYVGVSECGVAGRLTGDLSNRYV